MEHLLTHHPHLIWGPCIAIAMCAIVTIVAATLGWRRVLYVFKPVTTLLIILLAMHIPTELHLYKPLVVAGLVFSLVGDVLLMLPKDRFTGGLVAFLLAHLVYLCAFAEGMYGRGLDRAPWWVFVPLLAYAAVLMRALMPHVPHTLKSPVGAYSLALMLMAGQAVMRGVAGVPGGMAAAAGGILFVISDSVLALDRFRGPIRGGQAIVLATYFAAQTLIALSIR